MNLDNLDKSREQLLQELATARRHVEELERRARMSESRERAGEHTEREDLLETILTTAPAVVYLYDVVEGRDVWVNRTSRELLGWDEEQFARLGQTQFLDLLHPDDIRGVLRRLERLRELRSGAWAEVEYRMKTPSGSWRWLLDRGSVFSRQPDGSVRRILCVAIDVTERRETERALAASESRYRTLQKNLPAAFALLDPFEDELSRLDFRFVEVNEAASRLFGREPQEILGSTARGLFPEVGQWWYRQLREVAESGLPRHIERFFEPARRHLAVDLYRADAGLVAALVIDIEDRVRAEHALRENETRFRQISELISDFGYGFLIEGDGRLSMEWASRPFPLPEDSRLESAFDKTQIARGVHPEDLPLLRARVARLQAGREDVSVYRVVEDSGETRWMEDHCRPIGRRSSDGALRVICAARDVTEERRARAEREAYAEKVRQAEKLESLVVLAGGVAHDFNNLLVGILGNAELAIQELPPESPLQEYIRDITESAGRAADLSRQMLAYSGQGKLFVESIDLGALVDDMLPALEDSVPGSIRIRLLREEDPPAVRGDAGQIRQIVSNLVTNASEAIGDAEGLITLATGSMDCSRAYLETTYLSEAPEPGRYVYLEVTDSGAGVDPETLGRIFDPFFTTKFTGRGLGLAAVLGIVRGHGGAILVHSEPGRGSTFRVLLPAVETRSKAAEPSSSPLPSGTVLLVDDEPTIRHVTGRLLERLGLTVMTAATGEEALRIYRGQHEDISCVLLDATMPDMDGREILAQMRTIEPEAKVLLSSGYSAEQIAARFSGLGASEFVAKPYRMAALRESLQRVLQTE